MTRAEANYKIADILSGTSWESEFSFATQLREFTDRCPDQRAGQIICNYICSDYRNDEVAPSTTAFLGLLFPGNPDPFFEESVVTLQRLTKITDKLW